MSLHRYAAKRDANERTIITALEKAGATVEQLSKKGVPDLLVGWKTHNILLEVKSEDGDLTKAESDWHLLWRGTVWVVYTVEQALDVLATYDELDRIMMS